MANPGWTHPIRKAKYQITKNVFAACFLDILEADEEGARALLGVKQRSDTLAPPGTRIFFNVDSNREKSGEYPVFSMTVKAVEEREGQKRLLCTPIHKEIYPERRAQARRPLNFPVLLVDSQTLFQAESGASESLTLTYMAQKAILKLTVNRTYDFKVNFKGEDCHLQGVVKHIHYDWRTFEHRVGIHFPQLGKDEQIMLNLMVDPNYVVPISENQTVDTSAGKVSLNE